MLIGCCVNTMPRTRLAGAEYSPALAAAGYDFVEMPTNQLSKLTDREFREAAAVISESGVSCPVCNQFMTAEYKIVGPKEVLTPESVLKEYTDRAFERVGKNGLGFRIVVFGSPWSRICPEGWEMETALAQLEEFFRMLAVYAEKHGITIAVENNNSVETNTMNHMKDVFSMVRRVDHPSIRALCDYYHVRFEQDDPGTALEDGAELIVHTHIAKLHNREWFTDLTGEEQYVCRYADALRAVDFTGGISVEAPAAEDNWKDLVCRSLPVLKKVFA